MNEMVLENFHYYHKNSQNIPIWYVLVCYCDFIETYMSQSLYVSELTNPSILFILMQDMFDCITLDKCEEMFSYLEDRVALWKSVSYFVYCSMQGMENSC